MRNVANLFLFFAESTRFEMKLKISLTALVNQDLHLATVMTRHRMGILLINSRVCCQNLSKQNPLFFHKHAYSKDALSPFTYQPPWLTGACKFKRRTRDRAPLLFFCIRLQQQWPPVFVGEPIRLRKRYFE